MDATMEAVTLTERAARRIGEILKREPSGAMLRVSVEGGGCSGFQYKSISTRAGRRTISCWRARARLF
jgi:Uncharacterized conserved protein